MNFKGALRAVKNGLYNYADIEIRVREATHNDPGTVSVSLMSELARATHFPADYPQLFSMLWKRLNDIEYVNHVHKALIVVEYLLLHGSDRFVADVRRRNRDFIQLAKWRHLNDNGLDDTVECRLKAKSCYDLISDPDRLQQKRADVKAQRDEEFDAEQPTRSQTLEYTKRQGTVKNAKQLKRNDSDFQSENEEDDNDTDQPGIQPTRSKSQPVKRSSAVPASVKSQALIAESQSHISTKPVKPPVKQQRRAQQVMKQQNDDEEEEEDEEVEVKPKKKGKAKVATNESVEVDSNEEAEEIEQAKSTTKRKGASAAYSTMATQQQQPVTQLFDLTAVQGATPVNNDLTELFGKQKISQKSRKKQNQQVEEEEEEGKSDEAELEEEEVDEEEITKKVKKSKKKKQQKKRVGEEETGTVDVSESEQVVEEKTVKKKAKAKPIQQQQEEVDDGEDSDDYGLESYPPVRGYGKDPVKVKLKHVPTPSNATKKRQIKSPKQRGSNQGN